MKQKQKATITNAMPMERRNFPQIIHNNTATYNFVNWMTNQNCITILYVRF